MGRRSGRRNPAPEGTDDVLELLWDNWDDFGYKTSFAVSCRINGQLVDVGAVRLLIANHSTSQRALDQLRASGWDGTFPAPGIDYISVPSEITFYQQLKAHLGGERAIAIARDLRDASYLVRNLDEIALGLVDTTGFRDSLQRERGCIAAYLNGWKILENQAIAVQNFEFRFENVFRETSTLALNFASDSLLPHDINVLIGPNGAGKSRVMHQMVSAWINTLDGEGGFAEQPNLSQVVVVSYSPFERFPVDMEGVRVQDKDVYQYFGFRGRSGVGTDGKSRRIRLSHDFPKANAAQSLIACLADDQKFRVIVDWARKVSTMEEVLRTAFQFDFAAVEIDANKRVRNLYSDFNEVEGPADVEVDGRRYVPVASYNMNYIDAARLLDSCVTRSGVSFFRDGIPIERKRPPPTVYAARCLSGSGGL